MKYFRLWLKPLSGFTYLRYYSIGISLWSGYQRVRARNARSHKFVSEVFQSYPYPSPDSVYRAKLGARIHHHGEPAKHDLIPIRFPNGRSPILGAQIRPCSAHRPRAQVRTLHTKFCRKGYSRPCDCYCRWNKRGRPGGQHERTSPPDTDAALVTRAQLSTPIY